MLCFIVPSPRHNYFYLVELFAKKVDAGFNCILLTRLTNWHNNASKLIFSDEQDKTLVVAETSLLFNIFKSLQDILLL